MAVSDSRNFNIDVSDAIEEAYERCGIEVRAGYSLRTARRSLNLMLAEWANRGVNLFTIEQVTTTLTEGTASYTLGADTIDILEMVLRRSGTDTTMSRIGRGEYLNIPTKSDKGKPSQFFVDRQVNPVVNLWQTPENSTDQIVYYRLVRIDDADTYTNDFDLPFRFFPCLVAGLAYYLSMKVAPDRIAVLKSVYDEEFARAASEDRDRASLRLVPRIIS
jgi:hypothetical protein|tara:strand:- start:1212 stop:1868 length:657 start_codon:yes stop_codon:yes gene_type:complete